MCSSRIRRLTTSTWNALLTGSEAEEVVALLANAYDVADPHETARFFTAGSTLELIVWGLGVATTPDEVVAAVGQLS